MCIRSAGKTAGFLASGGSACYTGAMTENQIIGLAVIVGGAITGLLLLRLVLRTIERIITARYRAKREAAWLEYAAACAAAGVPVRAPAEDDLRQAEDGRDHEAWLDDLVNGLDHPWPRDNYPVVGDIARDPSYVPGVFADISKL